MKILKPLIISIGFILSTIMVEAQVQQQARKDLKGPAAKNYKPWKHKTAADSPKFILTNEREPLQGPTAKNYKPWKDDRKSETATIAVGSPRSDLKGPAAKNYKPWKKNEDDSLRGTRDDETFEN